jgi:hypothetical protein
MDLLERRSGIKKEEEKKEDESAFNSKISITKIT